jgi:hypothetical protein
MRPAGIGVTFGTVMSGLATIEMSTVAPVALSAGYKSSSRENIFTA